MFIRYPGSKDKIKTVIMRFAPEGTRHPLFSQELDFYCEPFFGSGAVGWQVLRGLSPTTSILVNDIDPGIAAIWRVVHRDPDGLVDKVKQFKPTVAAFNAYKAEDGDTCIDVSQQAFRKLALHQLSFSGLGYKAGGPIGGQKQRSEYNVDCRWNADRIALGIKTCHQLTNRFQHFTVNCEDFGETLKRVPPYKSSFVYLDPPYYVQGESLYRYSMTDDDHRRLAVILRRAKFRWLLSYDDAPRIKELYEFAKITSFEMTPSTQISKTQRRKNNELLIRNYE